MFQRAISLDDFSVLKYFLTEDEKLCFSNHTRNFGVCSECSLSILYLVRIFRFSCSEESFNADVNFSKQCFWRKTCLKYTKNQT